MKFGMILNVTTTVAVVAQMLMEQSFSFAFVALFSASFFVLSSTTTIKLRDAWMELTRSEDGEIREGHIEISYL